MGDIPRADFFDDMCDEGRRLVELTYDAGLFDELRDPARPVTQSLVYRVGDHLLRCETCWEATYGSIE